MSRSRHTDPRRIRGPRRVRAPYAPRGVGDLSTQRTWRAALKARGVAPVATDDGVSGALLRPARLPRVAVGQPSVGWEHPAGKADVERVLRYLGPAYTYGLRLVALVRQPAGCGRGCGNGVLRFASLRVPGIVLLYEQRPSPWVLAGQLRDDAAARFRLAGAEIALVGQGLQTVVTWPGATLRDFMLLDVLLHELGHHLLQHDKGKRPACVARTRDHERFADRFAQRARSRWEIQVCRLPG